ncbi:MAG: CopL family metal-binding regulatory protein [Xanthomonadales bacterium]|nr:CopL family metal-binding regulatory protein [Xanthomonadales bacterium]
MRRSLHPRSRIFRSLLVLALLAWTALAFNAFGQPLAMIDSGATTTQAATAMDGAAGTHCDGMPMGHVSPSSHPAPAHPAGDGHGCCQHGSCNCASLCTSIVDVPYLDMAWAPLHAPVLVPVHVAPALTQAAPPLRPPIV